MRRMLNRWFIPDRSMDASFEQEFGKEILVPRNESNVPVRMSIRFDHEFFVRVVFPFHPQLCLSE